MQSSFRIFGVTATASLLVLLAVGIQDGLTALFSVAVLAIIEITFSFDNAIVNAKILERLSPAWQTVFLTVGIILAVFAVRLVLPIVIVMLGAGIGFHNVIDLALHHPAQYANELAHAHPLIASFGGAFLLMLALDFFINGEHTTYWLRSVERRLKSFASFWLPPVVVPLLVAVLAFIGKSNTGEILIAGWLGVVVFIAIKSLNKLLAKSNHSSKVQTGWAGLGLFIYLEVLDASFSLDSIIGAFAITREVLLIAAGLGIGALWVRSLTIFIMRRKTLLEYKYIEHGAYYTIFMLAMALFSDLFIDIPGFLIGLAGLVIIGTSLFSSIQAKKSLATK